VTVSYLSTAVIYAYEQISVSVLMSPADLKPNHAQAGLAYSNLAETVQWKTSCQQS